MDTATDAFEGIEHSNKEPDSMTQKLDKIRGSVKQLEDACTRKIDAAEAFTNGCKLVALAAGFKPQVIAAFITARVNDKEAENQAKAAQLSLLFEEI